MTRIDARLTHETASLEAPAPLLGCRFDPGGRYVFAGAQDRSVVRWELETGTRTLLEGHKSWVRSLAFVEEGQVLITAGYDGRLGWWRVDEKTPRPIRMIDAHKGWIRSVAVSPDGKLVATAGNDLIVRLWSAADGKLVRELHGHTDHVYSVAFHPSGQHLVSADLKLVTRDWRVSDGKPLRSFDSAKVLHQYDKSMQCNLGGARSMAFHPDGETLLVGGIIVVATNIFDGGAGSKPTAAVIDWKTGKRRLLHRPTAPLPAVLWGLCWHKQGFWIGASGGAIGGHLLFWQKDEPDDFFRLKLPSPGRGLSLHPDGQRLAIPHFDARLRVFSMTQA
jgi:WD40 repeat protein